MKGTIENALVLEVYDGEFEDDKGLFVNYHKLAVYESGKGYPRLTLLKLPAKLVSVARPLVGKRLDIEVDIFQKKDSVDLTFAGVPSGASAPGASV